MNKRLLFYLFAFFLSACTMSSPFATPTPTSQIATTDRKQGLNTNSDLQQSLDCTQLKLTPEECANLGEHTYSYSELSCKIIKPYDEIDFCDGPSLEGTEQINITFSNNAVHYYDFTYPRISENIYSGRSLDDVPNTITFYQDGFVKEYDLILPFYPSTDTSPVIAVVRYRLKYLLAN